MRVFLSTAVALSVLILGGCDSAKSPEAVAKDVAAAQQKASTEVANSENAAAKDLGKAADKVDDTLANFNNAAAKDAYNLTLAKADGDLKVAMASCSAQAGDAQRLCKDQANADYAATKANAKAIALSQKQ